MTKQAIIYCRFSPRPDADTSKSNARQNERCTFFCEKKGYEICCIFSDESVSGSTLIRKGLMKALSGLSTGMILVVDSPDRLARDLMVDLTIRKQIADLGCTLEFADGSPNTETPEGELIHDIMAAFASYERKRYARRTKAGMAKKKSEGVWCGRPPYGWKKLMGIDQLVRSVEEQQQLELIQSLAESLTSSEIAKAMSLRHLTCRGRKWSDRSIRRILSKTRP